MKLKHNPSAPRLQGVDMTLRDFSVALQKGFDGTPTLSEPYSIAEEQLLRNTAPGPATKYSVLVGQDLKLRPPTLESLHPEVFSVSGSEAIKAANGVGTLRVTGYSGARDYTLDFADEAPPVSFTHVSFQAGTLAAHCTSNVLNRLQGKTQGGESQNIYADGGTHGPTVAECFTTGFNPSSIVSGLDLNCISFSRNNPDPFVASRHRFPALLVGPRHIIGAHHCIPTTGQNCIFRRPDGSFVETNVVYSDSLGFDMGVAMLDRDVTGIEFATLLPPTYKQKLKAGSKSVTQDLPQRSGALLMFGITSNTSLNLGFVRHAQVFGITDIGESTQSPFFIRTQVTFGPPAQAQASPFYSQPYGGDSGSPMFLVIEQSGVQRPVFLGNLYTALTTPSYPAFSPIVQAKFNEVGPALGYSTPFAFRYADQSAFPDVL